MHGCDVEASGIFCSLWLVTWHWIAGLRLRLWDICWRAMTHQRRRLSGEEEGKGKVLLGWKRKGKEPRYEKTAKGKHESV